MLKIAIKISQKVGDLLLKEYNNFSRKNISSKSKQEIITTADFIAEKYIISEIKKKFPSHVILSEEMGRTGKKSEYLWIIDPLDGTTNFAMHIPIFAISIALVKNNEVLFSVINAPAMKELYIAQKSKGATCNGKKNQVSSKNTLKHSFFTYCYGHTQKALKKSLEVSNKLRLSGYATRQLGSAGIELAFVASGRTEAIIIPDISTWDAIPGILLVREAGGRVTDFSGREWTLKSKDMLATNGKVHKELLKIIKTIK